MGLPEFWQPPLPYYCTVTFPVHRCNDEQVLCVCHQTEVFHFQKVWVNYVHGSWGADGSADWKTGTHGPPFFIYSSNQTATLNMFMKSTGVSSQRPWKGCSSQNGPTQEPWREGAENQEHKWTEESMPSRSLTKQTWCFLLGHRVVQGDVWYWRPCEIITLPPPEWAGVDAIPLLKATQGNCTLAVWLMKLAQDGVKTVNWPPCSRTQSILN